MSVQDYYRQGVAQLADGKLSAAQQTVDEMNINYPFHAETGELYVQLIKGYYEAGRADTVIELADRFVNMYPTHKNVAYIHYLAGMANYDRGRRNISMDVTTSDPTYAKAALARFRELVACCSNTKHAFDAKQYIYHLESMISLYELRYMEWDYDADRIDAAAQRGISLLVSYPESVAAKRARIMLESDNFRAYRSEINQAIRGAHPSVPVKEMAPVEQPAPSRFTIHVASDASLVELEAAVAEIGLKGEVDYYRVVEDDNTYYVAGYGGYADRDAAKPDRLKLRVRTEVPGLWVRSLANSKRVEDPDVVMQAELEARANAPDVGLASAAAEVLPASRAEPQSSPAMTDDFYAIQMMSYTKLDQLKRVVRKMGLADDVALYSHVVKGTTYYIALYGNYADWAGGKEGLAELERRTGKTDYWLRKIDTAKTRRVE